MLLKFGGSGGEGQSPSFGGAARLAASASTEAPARQGKTVLQNHYVHIELFKQCFCKQRRKEKLLGLVLSFNK